MSVTRGTAGVGCGPGSQDGGSHVEVGVGTGELEVSKPPGRTAAAGLALTAPRTIPAVSNPATSRPRASALQRPDRSTGIHLDGVARILCQS